MSRDELSLSAHVLFVGQKNEQVRRVLKPAKSRGVVDDKRASKKVGLGRFRSREKSACDKREDIVDTRSGDSRDASLLFQDAQKACSFIGTSCEHHFGRKNRLGDAREGLPPILDAPDATNRLAN